jgi:hypothetical protein
MQLVDGMSAGVAVERGLYHLPSGDIRQMKFW